MSALLNIQIHIKLTRKRYLYITLNIELTLLAFDNFANLMAKCKKKNNFVTTNFSSGKTLQSSTISEVYLGLLKYL